MKNSEQNRTLPIFPQDSETIQELRECEMCESEWGAIKRSLIWLLCMNTHALAQVAHRSHSDKVSLDFVIATAVEQNESEAQPVAEHQSEPESERKGYERAAENSPQSQRISNDGICASNGTIMGKLVCGFSRAHSSWRLEPDREPIGNE